MLKKTILLLMVLMVFQNCKRIETPLPLKEKSVIVKPNNDTKIFLDSLKAKISYRESRNIQIVVRNNKYFGMYQIHKMYLDTLDKGLFLTDIRLQDSILNILIVKSIQELNRVGIPATIKNIDLCHRWGIYGSIKKIKKQNGNK